jgi:hypothetical protein
MEIPGEPTGIWLCYDGSAQKHPDEFIYADAAHWDSLGDGILLSDSAGGLHIWHQTGEQVAKLHCFKQYLEFFGDDTLPLNESSQGSGKSLSAQRIRQGEVCGIALSFIHSFFLLIIIIIINLCLL